MLRKRYPLALLVVSLFVLASSSRADWKDDIGFTALFNERAGLEDGTGVVVSQVENPSNTNYFPNIGSSQFIGKSFTDGSGGGTESSTHANSVANYLYGNTRSVSPGVTDVTMYEVSNWVFDVLNSGTFDDPNSQDFDVQNHSWIGTLGSDAADLDALYRVDYLIDQSHMTMTVGLNNGNGAPPKLLSHAFNAISVGRYDGIHSYGTTSMYTSGRLATDIVAPISATSYAAPIVGSAAALLIDAAPNTDARRTETIRAIIMAGATKNEFSDWDRTSTRPLDEKYGAGELNIYNSYKILAGGEYNGSTSEPGSAVGEYGYDYVEGLDPDETLYYTFEVGPGKRFEEVSILLTWNMEITDLNASDFWAPSANIADMNMAFYDSSSSFLGSLLDSSLSPVDNKEHFYFAELGEGTYTLAITTDRNQDFAVAWRADSRFVSAPEPAAGFVLGILALGWIQTRRRRFIVR